MKWNDYIGLISKTDAWISGSLFRTRQFVLRTNYLATGNKNTIRPGIEEFCLFSSSVDAMYLEIIVGIQRTISHVIAPDLAFPLTSLFHRYYQISL